MKINELRVGNWFYRYCCNDQVMEVRAGGVIGLDRNRGIICLHEMQPIPLTKEFFEKNGFILQEDLDYYGDYFMSEDMRIDVYESSSGWVVHIDDKECSTTFSKCLKYVHELQNAYYVSTAEEMEVKL
jgi:hypothetical protein